jgi:hypothetical protein
MNWKLARLVAGWTTGVWLALAAWQVPVLPPPTNAPPSYIARSPRRTAGCPALLAQVAAWQRELSLEDWALEVECGITGRERDPYVGLCWADPDTKKAEIQIREGLPPGYQQAVVVHELAHVAVAAGRWWVPDGWEEEDFVLIAADRWYFGRRYDIRQRMLHEVRRRASPHSSAGPPPATHTVALSNAL